MQIALQAEECLSAGSGIGWRGAAVTVGAAFRFLSSWRGFPEVAIWVSSIRGKPDAAFAAKQAPRQQLPGGVSGAFRYRRGTCPRKPTRRAAQPALHSQPMAVAAIDRLVHYAVILEINTESYRRKTAISRASNSASAKATTTQPVAKQSNRRDDNYSLLSRSASDTLSTLRRRRPNRPS
jgi:hypothetical protein